MRNIKAIKLVNLGNVGSKNRRSSVMYTLPLNDVFEASIKQPIPILLQTFTTEYERLLLGTIHQQAPTLFQELTGTIARLYLTSINQTIPVLLQPITGTRLRLLRARINQIIPNISQVLYDAYLGELNQEAPFVETTNLFGNIILEDGTYLTAIFQTSPLLTQLIVAAASVPEWRRVRIRGFEHPYGIFNYSSNFSGELTSDTSDVFQEFRYEAGFEELGTHGSYGYSPSSYAVFSQFDYGFLSLDGGTLLSNFYLSPNAPSTLSVEEGDDMGELTFEWLAPVSGTTPTHYDIEWGIEAYTETDDTTDLFYEITDGEEGETYWYRVRSKFEDPNNPGTWLYSSWVSNTFVYSTIKFYTDFSEYDENEVPADWTLLFGTATWKVVTYGTPFEVKNGKVLKVDQFATAGTKAIVWNMHGASNSDMEIVARMRCEVYAGYDTFTSPEVAVRIDPSYIHVVEGPNKSAITQNFSSYARVYRIESGAYAEHAVGTDGGDLNPTAWKYYRLKVNGNTIYGKIWDGALSDEPGSWEFTTTTNVIDRAGYIGLNFFFPLADYYVDQVGVSFDGTPAEIHDI